MQHFTSSQKGEFRVPTPTFVTHFDELSPLKQHPAWGQIPYIHPAAKGSEETGATPGKRCSVCVFKYILSDASWAPTFVLLLRFTLTSELTAGCINNKWNLNVLNIIGKADKQKDLHFSREGQWQTHAAYGTLQVRCCPLQTGCV